jgi:hypothetical protein
MIAQPFYHKTVSKTLIAFGSLFSGMSIDRATQDSSRTQRIPVPLTYGPKEKVLELVRKNPDIERSISVVLPRIAFEMTGIQYDPMRKVPKTMYITTEAETANMRKRLWSPVPYTMILDMDIICKYQEDGLQIIEQIVPFFQPEMNVTIFDVPGTTRSRDVPIVLTSISVADEYESGIETNRLITWTLSFEAKIFLYRPISEGKVIKKVEVKLYDDLPFEDWIQQYTASVVPESAGENDKYLIKEFTAEQPDLINRLQAVDSGDDEANIIIETTGD